MNNGDRVQIRVGWEHAGRQGLAIGQPVFIQQWWLAVLWDDEEDPDFHKLSGLMPAEKMSVVVKKGRRKP